MQISRHWRLNPLRYRLEAVRQQDGTVVLQQRPASPADVSDEPEAHAVEEHTHVLVQRRAS